MCGVFQEAIFLHLFPPVIPGDLTKTTLATALAADPRLDRSKLRTLWLHKFLQWPINPQLSAPLACRMPFVCVRMIVRALVHGKGSVGDPSQSLHSTEWGRHTEPWRDIWRWGCLFVLINTNEPRLAWNSIGFFCSVFFWMVWAGWWEATIGL